MSLPLSFGSFGDILSTVQLALAIADTIKDAKGTPAGVLALTEDMVSVSRAVNQIQEILEGYPTHLTPEFRKDLERPLSICHEMLNLIHTYIKTYDARSGRRFFAKYRAAVAWNVAGRRREVQAMKQRLWEQIGIVHTFLAIYNSNNFARLAVNFEAHLQTVGTTVAAEQKPAISAKDFTGVEPAVHHGTATSDRVD